MVTIEQKLSVFNKLLQRSMEDGFTEEMKHLREEYSEKLRQSNESADKEAKHIEERATRKARNMKAEALNKAAMNQRKAYMTAKEELFSIMLVHLRERVDAFIQSDEYEAYLLSLAKQLQEAENSPENIKIYATKEDCIKYGEKIATVMPSILKDGKNIDIAEDKIIGGLILLNVDSNTRTDLSIKTLLEENKAYMMQTFFQAF